MTHQMALAFQLNHEATFEDFCWQGNEWLGEQLLSSMQGGAERLFYIWGSKGSGKSHVLQACCQAMSQAGRSAIYMPLSLLHDWDTSVLDGLDDQALVAIDDIDAVAHQPMWQEALFHLYNKILDKGETLFLITGQHSPALAPIELADLRSRLACGLVIQLHELSHESKMAVLQAYAKKRGFELPNSVCLYVVNRCARNMHDLYNILETLDKASLAAQRKITIPFVKEILGM